MQGLADGYFIIPYTLGNYLAGTSLDKTITCYHDAFERAENEARTRINKLLSIQGDKTVTHYHRELGKSVWNHVGMARNKTGLLTACDTIAALRNEFWERVRVPGVNNTYNKNLEFATRVADFLELAQLMAQDALRREESCGGHFREEYQTPGGEALRRDTEYADVAAWEYTGNHDHPKLHLESLEFENVQLTTRSYK